MGQSTEGGPRQGAGAGAQLMMLVQIAPRVGALLKKMAAAIVPSLGMTGALLMMKTMVPQGEVNQVKIVMVLNNLCLREKYCQLMVCSSMEYSEQLQLF